jgi:hypothetical protein
LRVLGFSLPDTLPAIEMMPDVNPLPRGERRIESCVDSQVPLTSHGPCGKVIEGAHCRRSQHHAVNGCFENLATAGAQKRQWVALAARRERLFAHTCQFCKGHASRMSHSYIVWTPQRLC